MPGGVGQDAHRLDARSACRLHPTSRGSLCHGIPERRRHRIPPSTGRAGTRGRPPFGLGSSGGRSGSILSHSDAEGFERFGATEFKRFLAIARGSAAEVRSQRYLAKDLHYLDEREFQRLLADCLEVTRMLTTLRNSIETRS